MGYQNSAWLTPPDLNPSGSEECWASSRRWQRETQQSCEKVSSCRNSRRDPRPTARAARATARPVVRAVRACARPMARAARAARPVATGEVSASVGAPCGEGGASVGAPDGDWRGRRERGGRQCKNRVLRQRSACALFPALYPISRPSTDIRHHARGGCGQHGCVSLHESATTNPMSRKRLSLVWSCQTESTA